MKNIDVFYDLIDKMAMIYYQNLGVDYLDSLILAADFFSNKEYDQKISTNEYKKLESLYLAASKINFSKEEIRLASQLLIIKAFKHINYSLDLMSPDIINYLIINVIRKLFANKKISIIDTALGTGNLLQAIVNHLSTTPELFGIEHDQRLVNLGRALFDLQKTEIIIYYQDALKQVNEMVDLVIGDISSYYIEDNPLITTSLYKQGVRFFPFLAIHTRLNNLKENGYFIYVIDNDFFSREGNNVFNKEIKQISTLMGLIVLPKNIHQEHHVGRSILIGKKAIIDNYQMLILSIDNSNAKTLMEAVNNIDLMIEKF